MCTGVLPKFTAVVQCNDVHSAQHKGAMVQRKGAVCTLCSTMVQCNGVPAKLKSLIGPTIAKPAVHCTSDGRDDDYYVSIC